MRARVGDRCRRLRGEQDQDLLVLGSERLAVLLVGEKEVPEVLAPVVHRRPLQRLRPPRIRGEAERAEVAGEIGHPERRRKVAQVLEEPWSVGPLQHHPPLFGRKPGGDEILHLPPLVNRRDHAVAGAGQRARALHHLLEHGGQLKALADAENRRAQPGDAVVAVTVRGPASIRIVHFGLHSPPKGEASRPGSTGPPGKWKDSAVRTACHAYDM